MENLKCINCKKEIRDERNELNMFAGSLAINPHNVSDFKKFEYLCVDCLKQINEFTEKPIWGNDENFEEIKKDMLNEWFNSYIKDKVKEAEDKGRSLLVIGTYTQVCENFKPVLIKEGKENEFQDFISKLDLVEVKGDISNIFDIR